MLSHDSDFVQSHLNFNKSMDLLYNNGRIISRWTCNVITKNFHPLKSRYLHLGGSVNGLVCVYHHDYTRRITYLGICNPATNQCKDIPISSRAASRKFTCDDYGFAIGFNSFNNDYKLVFITMFRDQPLVADVYSCNTCSWRKDSVVSSLLSRGYRWDWACPTIVQGCPYWYHCMVESFENLCVVCFDVQHEVFRFLPGIQSVDINTQYEVLVNLRDSLGIIVHDFPRSRSTVLIYVFDELCGDWIKNFNIQLITVPRYMEFIHCFKNGDLLFFDDKHFNVLSVNPKSDKSDSLNGEWCSYDDDAYYSRLCLSQSSDYLETLVTVKGMYPLRDCKAGPHVFIIERCT